MNQILLYKIFSKAIQKYRLKREGTNSYKASTKAKEEIIWIKLLYKFVKNILMTSRSQLPNKRLR